MGKPDGTASSAKKQRADTVTGRKDELDALRESWSGSATGYQRPLNQAALRADGGDRGDVGIIRSPVRASILPD
jgi:hypothetical protein